MDPSEAPRQEVPRQTRDRTFQACQQCRRSKIRCDGVRSRCGGCVKRNRVCVWPRGLSYHYGANQLEPSQQNQVIAAPNSPATYLNTPPTFLNTPFVLPAPHLVERLFQIFFKRHHEAEFCAFLHKPSLDIHALYTRSPALVTSIISLGALYVSDHEAMAEFGFQSSAALSQHLASFAKSQANDIVDQPSICNIQTFLILAIRELLSWSNVKAYMHAGTAIRMAQVLHLNVETSQRFPDRQKEIRRRTFWSCFIVDRLVSYSYNKPFAIPFHLVKVNIPCPENVFAFDAVYSGFTVEALALEPHKVSQFEVMPFFIVMVLLWGDMAFFHVSGGRRRAKFGPHAPEGEFYQSEKAIERFSANLPSHLSWSLQNYKIHQVTGQTQAYVNLNFLLLHSRCVMHQEYMPQMDLQHNIDPEVNHVKQYDAAGIPLEKTDKALMHICMISVHAITEMALTLSKGPEKDRQHLQSIFAANAILTASAVHLWILYSVPIKECPKHEALAVADKLRHIIMSWQPQWPVARAWVETLEMLYQVYVFTYGKVVGSEPEGWEIESGLINAGGDAIITGDRVAPIAVDEDTIQDSSLIHRRLFDKIRSILSNSILARDVKKRHMKVYSQTLWQILWTFSPIEGVDDELFDLGVEGSRPSEAYNSPYSNTPECR